MTSPWVTILRMSRGWLYRRFPAWGQTCFCKKLSGWERRWNLEAEGFTKEGFFKIFQRYFLSRTSPGKFWELGVGDGLVGSLGLWLESSANGWQVEAWEHRPLVFKQFQPNRPITRLHPGRLIDWQIVSGTADLKAVTVRGAREASGLCREIRQGSLRPAWLGIWNPTRRPVWYWRMRREGYRLELVWHNMEFYWRPDP